MSRKITKGLKYLVKMCFTISKLTKGVPLKVLLGTQKQTFWRETGVNVIGLFSPTNLSKILKKSNVCTKFKETQ